MVMELHEPVRAGEVYAWIGVDQTSRTSRRMVMRPVLTVDVGRVWTHEPMATRWEVHPWRKYGTYRMPRWGWLGLQTAWSWPVDAVPDDLDRERVARHVEYLGEQAGLVDAVARRTVVADGQLPAAPPGMQPSWCRIRRRQELHPWSIDIEHWGKLGLEVTDVAGAGDPPDGCP